MSLYKRGKCYWFKFQIGGKLVRKSAETANDKEARRKERAEYTRLSKEKDEREAEAQNLGCKDVLRCAQCRNWFDATTAIENGTGQTLCSNNCVVEWRKQHVVIPILHNFLVDDFQPYVETAHRAKPGTVEYYTDGIRMLLKSDMASLRLDEITDQNAQQFASRLKHLSASRINCGLRTLRRALRLAVDWGKLQTRAKITLAKGERMRERVVTDSEMKAYLAACPQPWKDAATIIRGSAACPGEVFALRWPNVLLNGHGGLIQITDGKTKFRKRLLPMVPEVYVALKDRWEAAGRPSEGWVFPSDSEDGHFNGDSAKDQHAKALRDSGVKPFEPYCLRHTALTRLAESGCDAFTLMRIAGHSNIQTTMRYIHPQAEAVEMAFQRVQGELTGHKIGHNE